LPGTSRLVGIQFVDPVYRDRARLRHPRHREILAFSCAGKVVY